MTTRLDYVTWDEISEKNQQQVKKQYQAIEAFIEETLQNSREKTLALIKLEESWMWVGKSIKVDQQKRTQT